VEQFERATTAANVPKGTLAMTEQEVQSAIARGYSGVGQDFDVLSAVAGLSFAVYPVHNMADDLRRRYSV